MLFQRCSPKVMAMGFLGASVFKPANWSHLIVSITSHPCYSAHPWGLFPGVTRRSDQGARLTRPADKPGRRGVTRGIHSH